MRLTPLIEKAICRSAQLHRYQERRHSDIPYAAHPFAIAFMLQEYTNDEQVITAALLHDVLEDVRGYEYTDLQKEFGKHVAVLVLEVSEEKSPYSTKKKDKESWKNRKDSYIKNLETASQGALLISAGDKYHNLLSLREIHKVHGDAMWSKFHAPEPKAESTMWFYKSVLDVIKRRLKSPVVKELEKMYAKARKEFL